MSEYPATVHRVLFIHLKNIRIKHRRMTVLDFAMIAYLCRTKYGIDTAPTHNFIVGIAGRFFLPYGDVPGYGDEGRSLCGCSCKDR